MGEVGVALPHPKLQHSSIPILHSKEILPSRKTTATSQVSEIHKMMELLEE